MVALGWSRLVKKMFWKKIKNENGTSLIELLGVLVISGILFSLIITIFSTITKVSSIQTQQVEMQIVANNIVYKLEKISRIEDIYSNAGYFGKFVGNWEENQINKVLKKSSTDEWIEIKKNDQGDNLIALTDINDSLYERLELFKIKDSNIKIKILQQKNKNDITKTIYKMPNYRDSFSIQTSFAIIFYENEFDFQFYYNSQTNSWDYEGMKNDRNLRYIREGELSYRDDAKAKGELPGNGRW